MGASNQIRKPSRKRIDLPSQVLVWESPTACSVRSDDEEIECFSSYLLSTDKQYCCDSSKFFIKSTNVSSTYDRPPVIILTCFVAMAT